MILIWSIITLSSPLFQSLEASPSEMELSRLITTKSITVLLISGMFMEFHGKEERKDLLNVATSSVANDGNLLQMREVPPCGQQDCLKSGGDSESILAVFIIEDH